MVIADPGDTRIERRMDKEHLTLHSWPQNARCAYQSEAPTRRQQTADGRKVAAQGCADEPQRRDRVVIGQRGMITEVVMLESCAQMKQEGGRHSVIKVQ